MLYEVITNLYWFRKDWFDRADLQAKFKEMYGYDLGVPVNWSAYEDIAEFFSVHVKEIDGVRVYGHMDYGKRAPDLGRIDAQLLRHPLAVVLVDPHEVGELPHLHFLARLLQHAGDARRQTIAVPVVEERVEVRNNFV